MKLVIFATISLLLATVASAARVKPASIAASSVYPEEAGVRYEARQAIDGKLGTSWVEGDPGSGLGSWLKVTLPSPTKVSGIKVWGGLWYSYDYWTRANRPKTLEVKFTDGAVEMVKLEDKMEAQILTFAKTHDTADMRIRIKEIYNGNTWFDTAISEIQVIDNGSAGYAESKGFSHSSKLADDGDGNYNPNNMMDGVADSMWCEGNKEGDGTGEWIETDFGTTRSISSLRLINGVGGSFGAWMKSNRALKATLQFSDGSTHPIDIKNSMMMQSVTIPQTHTSRVRITFDTVAKGKEYNDLCLSELYFN
ncbi:MAG: hypothetical protein ACI9MC_000435 [Kiritimatiellia bacterium]|jgi:hypothetical protein